MIAGIFLGVFSVILFIVAGIACRRAVTAATPPPVVYREPLALKLLAPMPAEPESPPPIPTPTPDEWDALMVDIQRAIESGRLRL